MANMISLCLNKSINMYSNMSSVFSQLKSLLSVLYFNFIKCCMINNQGLFILLGLPVALIPLNNNHFLLVML